MFHYLKVDGTVDQHTTNRSNWSVALLVVVVAVIELVRGGKRNNDGWQQEKKLLKTRGHKYKQ